MSHSNTVYALYNDVLNRGKKDRMNTILVFPPTTVILLMKMEVFIKECSLSLICVLHFKSVGE